MKTKEAALKARAGTGKELRDGIFGRLANLDASGSKPLGYLLRFAAGWLLSRVSLLGISPLAPGFAGACGGGFGGFAAAMGAVMGAVTGGGFNRAVKYSAITLLIYSAAFIFRDMRVSKKAWFMPLAVALMTACTGFVYVRHGGWGMEETVLYIAEVVLAAGSCVLYSAALNRGGDEKGYIGKAAFGMSLSLALVRLNFFGTLSLGRCFAAFSVLAAAFAGGAGAGSIAGVALGMGVDAAMGTAGVCAMVYGFAGMFSGFYVKRGRLAVAVCYVLAGAVGAFWGAGRELRTTLLVEAFIASVAFMLPPNEWFLGLRGEKAAARHKGAVRELEYRLSKAELAASAFEEIYGILKKNCESGRNDADISSVFDVAAEEVCRNCGKRGECWGQKYETTRNALNDAARLMTARGGAFPEDFPQYFRDSCLNIAGFAAAASVELRALLRRRQIMSRMRENRELLYRQFEDTAKALRCVSAGRARDKSVGFEDEQKLEARIDAYLRGAGIAAESLAFRDGNGRLHVDLEGDGVPALVRTKNWLDLLSAAAGVRLCCGSGGKSESLLRLHEAEPLVVNVGIASLCKEGQEQSGDMASYFKTSEGVMYLLISDGMGSGREAAGDSGDAVKIAEMLLKAGLEADLAISILNSAMLLRSDKNMGCASVDLMGINLFTGETMLYKLGAAPSYVRKGNKVFEVGGSSLAAGLGGAPDLTKLTLSEGSAAVILSDGAAGSDEILGLLYDINGENVRKIAGGILENAARRSGSRDDMTVLALSVEARK